MKIFLRDDPDPFANTVLLGQVRKHDLIFHLEKDKYTYVDTPQEADIIPLMLAPFDAGYKPNLVTVEEQYEYIKPLRSNQWLIILFYTHAGDRFNLAVKNKLMLEKWARYTDNLLTVDLNSIGAGPRHIYNNFSFNFVKALFTEYNRFDFSRRMWTNFCTSESFTLSEIAEFNPIKRFLIPNIIRNSDEYKEVVRKGIKKNIIKPEDCFYSDHTEDSNAVFLEPKETSDYFKAHYNPTGSNLFPIKDSYYTESVVSVYSESICTGAYGVNVISEKTYIPLIRGHYIMPFGYPGIIKDILNQGFKLPKWIDYSYDRCLDDKARLNAYIKAVYKLRNISLTELKQLANSDIDIIKHNRQLFFTKPYMSLYDEIKSRIN